MYKLKMVLIMQSITVSDLRANLMKILKQIEHGLALDVTSRGKIIAKLVPPFYSKELAREKLTAIGNKAEIHDIIAPIAENWEVDNS